MVIDTILEAVSEKHKTFASMQEAARKDIERAFRVLQALWHIIREPARFTSLNDMKRILKTVVILHNMMVEEQCFAECEDGEEIVEGIKVSSSLPPCGTGLKERTKSLKM